MMGSNHKPGLKVITDRKTIETKLIKISTKKAKVIAAKIIKKLKRETTKIYTLTFDNGLEFAEHQEIAKSLKVKTLTSFCNSSALLGPTPFKLVTE